jgi:hypothetical protein
LPFFSSHSTLAANATGLKPVRGSVCYKDSGAALQSACWMTTTTSQNQIRQNGRQEPFGNVSGTMDDGTIGGILCLCCGIRTRALFGDSELSENGIAP